MSEWTTRIGEISKLKKAPGRFRQYGAIRPTTREKSTWDAVYAVLNVDALRAITLAAVFEVPFKLRCAVLVGVDLEPAVSTWA